uniref:Uncharacterized protein n=1 Tax=Anguilla anguilla TaxID=7936 RepID=A0A0E9TWV7_ANGAN
MKCKFSHQIAVHLQQKNVWL